MEPGKYISIPRYGILKSQSSPKRRLAGCDEKLHTLTPFLSEAQEAGYRHPRLAQSISPNTLWSVRNVDTGTSNPTRRETSDDFIDLQNKQCIFNSSLHQNLPVQK